MPVREEQVGAASSLPVSRPSPGRRAALVLSVCFVLGLISFWLPLRGVHLDAMNGYGLISVLPILTLAGAALLIVTFFLTLGLNRPHRVLLGLQLVSLVFMLHGLGPALEELARPPTAWQHLGFVEYILRTGEPHVALDARYSWPAFFTLIGFVTKAAGIGNLEPIMHWSSVGLELLYLVAFYLILRVMWANWRAKWFAAWMLVAADWVGQDYFAPQGFGFLLYLLFLGILLNWFMPTGEQDTWRPRRAFLSLRSQLMTPGERQVGRPSPREQTVVLLVLLGVFLFTVASHQLTPYLMLFAATGLVLMNRSTLRGLPILLGVVIAAWVSYMAKAYWAANTGDLFSGLGNLFDTLGSSVGGRVSKSSPELGLIQQTRILIAVVVVSLAFMGLYRRRRWRFDDRVAMVLLFVPFLAIGLQNYGGEITLRVYFFVLPGACLLVAYLFFPTAFTIARPVRAVAAAAVCGLVIAGLFIFVRFGNENFEQVRPGEVQAFESMLRASPKGRINIVWVNGLKDPEVGGFPQAPWGLAAQERWDYTEVQAPAKPEDVKPVVDALRQQPGGYFLTTRGNEAYNHYNFGLSADYAGRMLKALNASAELRPVLRNKDADLFVLRTPLPDPPPPVVPPTRFNIGKTTWTQVGILATVLLVLVLTVREIARIRGNLVRRRKHSDRAAEEHPVLWGFGLAVWPLLALSIFVIFERFHTLGSG